MIVTQSALNRIAILTQQNQSLFMRVEIKAGGCSGFEKVFSISSQEPDDHVINNAVLVDSSSWEMLEHAILDYKQSVSEQKFVLTVPDTNSDCGCGRSFSI